jgi:hypothetical protein
VVVNAQETGEQRQTDFQYRTQQGGQKSADLVNFSQLAKWRTRCGNLAKVVFVTSDRSQLRRRQRHFAF